MSSHDQPTAIRLTNITKVYTIHHEKPTLVEKFIKNKEEKFVALQNINLEIKKGERVGITGPNGSGKTTLLKIIAGITTPTRGTVTTNGRLVSLIDLEAGFHPDLTGIQNVYLNGMLLGLTKKEIDKKINSIIAFADIRQFIDVPMYTYSSGMMLRLGFAILISANPDILLMDEGFIVGDSDFQKKILVTVNDYMRRHKTIVVVSQHLELLQRITKRIIWMNQGMIETDRRI